MRISIAYLGFAITDRGEHIHRKWLCFKGIISEVHNCSFHSFCWKDQPIPVRAMEITAVSAAVCAAGEGRPWDGRYDNIYLRKQ